MPITHKDLLKLVPLGDVIPRDDNPRTNEDTVLPLAKSILRFGLVKDSVVVDEAMEVWCGDTTTKAIRMINERPELFVDDDNSITKYGTLRELFISKFEGVIPEVTQFFGLTFEEKLEYRIADNKTPESSGWDLQKLKPQLARLMDGGRDPEATSFPPNEHKLIMQDRGVLSTQPADLKKQKMSLPNYEESSSPNDRDEQETNDNDDTERDQTRGDWSEAESSGAIDTGDAPYVVHLAFSTRDGAISFLREHGFDDVVFAPNRRLVAVDMAERARKAELANQAEEEVEDDESN